VTNSNPPASTRSIDNDTAITARIKMPTGVTAFERDTLDAKKALAVTVTMDDDVQLKVALKLALMVMYGTSWPDGHPIWDGWYILDHLNERAMILVGSSHRPPEDDVILLPQKDGRRVRLEPVELEDHHEGPPYTTSRCRFHELPTSADSERMAGLVMDWFESIRPNYPHEDGVTVGERDNDPKSHEWCLEIVVDPSSALHQHLNGCVLLRACWVRYR